MLKNKINENIKLSLGEKVFSNWFSNIEYKFQNNIVTVCSPTLFIQNWISENYFSELSNALKKEISYDEIKFNLLCKNNSEDFKDKNLNKKLTKYTFDNFIVDESNNLAHSVFKEAIEKTNYNPIFIYGDVGVGKTHLLNAFFNMKKDFQFFTAESFTFNFVNSLIEKDGINFKKNILASKGIIIDDMHFINGKKVTQDQIIHLVSSFIDEDKQILIAANKVPNEIINITESLKSRLNSGLVINIENPSICLKKKAIYKIIEKKKLHLSADEVEKIALGSKNIREVESKINNIYVRVKLGKPIQEIYINKKITPEEIIKFTCDFYRITEKQIVARNRCKNILKARKTAIFLCKKYTGMPLKEIGRKFNRQHPTIINAINKFEKSEEENSCHVIEKILNNLKN